MAGRTIVGHGTRAKRALALGNNRLRSAIKGRPPDDIAAAALLRRSRIGLARASGRVFEDLATGDILMLLPTPFSDAIGDGVSFGLFTAIANAHIAAARPLVPLGDEALALGRGFVRPGNLGLGNGVRCAEAIYRRRRRLAEGSCPGPIMPARKPKNASNTGQGSNRVRRRPGVIASARRLAQTVTAGLSAGASGRYPIMPVAPGLRTCSINQ